MNVFNLAQDRAAHKTVLLIEDDIELQKVYEDTLSIFGYTALTASTLEEVLKKKIDWKNIFCVISDYLVNTSNGVAICDEIFQLGYRGPFILISGIIDFNSLPKPSHGKIHSYLGKPFPIQKLAQKLKELEPPPSSNA